jgi:hypothetical protein
VATLVLARCAGKAQPAAETSAPLRIIPLNGDVAESILSLKPTIAIGTAEAGPPEVIAQLKQAGVRVETVAVPSTVDTVPRPHPCGRGGHDAVPDRRAKKTPSCAMPRVAGTGTRAATMISATGFVDAGATSGIQGHTGVAPAEQPVGVVTALIGGPFFLFLLIRTRRSQGGWA